MLNDKPKHSWEFEEFPKSRRELIVTLVHDFYHQRENISSNYEVKVSENLEEMLTSGTTYIVMH